MPTVQSTVQEFTTFFKEVGGQPNQWYVGIANDAERRLFQEHNVTQQSRTWIYELMNNHQDARTVEEHFLSLGFKGGPGGGDNTSKYVYAYHITSTTRQ